MGWITFALLSPALSALGNYADKYLLAPSTRSGGVGGVAIFSCLFAVLVLPIAFIFASGAVFISSLAALALMVNGALTVGALIAYLYLIRDTDVLTAVPILQLAPVFGYIFGYFILAELLTPLQIIGAVIIVLCASLLSVEIREYKLVRYNARNIALAGTSSLLLAVSGVVFKLFATDVGFWGAQFWEYLGILCTGMLLFIFVSSYRIGFSEVIKKNAPRSASMNFGTETVMVLSDFTLNYAMLLAPVALVYSVASFHSVFLLMYRYAGSKIIPSKVGRFSLRNTNDLLMAVTILIMTLGATLLYLG